MRASVNLPTESESPARARVLTGLGRNHSATGGTTSIIQHTSLQRYPKVPTRLQTQLGLVFSSVATGSSQPVVCASINLSTESESPARARVLTGLGRNHSATGGTPSIIHHTYRHQKPKAPSDLEFRRGLTLATIAKGGSPTIIRHARHGDRERIPTFVGGGKF